MDYKKDNEIKTKTDLFLQRNGLLRNALTWQEEVDGAAQHCGGEEMKHVIFKLSLAAALSNLWMERNRRVFQGSSLPVKEISCRAEAEIRACISSWSMKKTDELGYCACSGGSFTKLLQGLEVE